MFVKRISFCILALTLLLGTSAQAENLVANPSFEDGFDEFGGLLGGWLSYGGWVLDGDVTGDPGATDGHWYAYAGGTGITAAGLYQMTGQVVAAAGEQYTLTVDVTDLLGGFELHARAFYLDPAVVYLDDGFLPADMWTGSPIELSVPITTTEASVGYTLGVDIYGGGPGGWGHFDNVRLELVPEPSTFVLAVFGLLGLAFCGLRRRKR